MSIFIFHNGRSLQIFHIRSTNRNIDTPHRHSSRYAPQIMSSATAPLSEASATTMPNSAIFLPSKFVPPKLNSTPAELFKAETRRVGSGAMGSLPGDMLLSWRSISRTNPAECLIRIAGVSVVDNGSALKGGCAFVLSPPQTQTYPPSSPSTVSFRLENHRTPLSSPFINNQPGTTTEIHPQTTLRATLRAAIGALQYKDWWLEGWTSIVIGSDLDNLVFGATSSLAVWEKNGWLTVKKTPVKNRDLWELLLQECRRLTGLGINVSFWMIMATANKQARTAAKRAVEEVEEVEDFVMVKGA